MSLVAVLVPSLAFAQAISGTFSGTFENFDGFGIPQVRLNLSLQCSLTCDPSAPVKTFGVAGGAWAYFVSAPTESAAYLSAAFGSADTGQTNVINTNFKTGSVSFVEAKSCTCHCGNRTGEGGYVTLRTANIVIPARLSSVVLEEAGQQSIFLLTAKPYGSESLVLSISGAGLSETRTFTATDFPGTREAVTLLLTPTVAGPLTLVVTMQPSGTVTTETFTIAAGTSGSGGGSGSTGGGSGGSGGGGDGSEPAGCSAVGLGPLALLALGLLRRRPSTPGK